MNPDEHYWHGLDSVARLEMILVNGLHQSTSISSAHGQATSYPILLMLPGDVKVESVGYRPEDFYLMEAGIKPLAVYVIPEDYADPIRPVDEINRELGDYLGELEAKGTITPERVGELTGDYPALYAVDRKLGDLMKELDKSIDLESRGIKGRVGGEQVLRNILGLGPSIPVYRLRRDDEGEIDWGSAAQVT